MIFGLPIIGPVIGLVLAACLAIPFYFVWNAVAPTYFYWLPPVYQAVPFWDCVLLIATFSMLKLILLPRFGTRIETKDDKS
jgi:hypothetical protein